MVLIISRNPATALSLRSYFGLHGLEAGIGDNFEAAREDCPAGTIVVFPDEFPLGQGMEGIAGVIRRVPKALVIVVTGQTANFEVLAAEHRAERFPRFRVFPRAIWGWTLLEEVMKSLRPAVDPGFDWSSER
jgi:hypothetical protein